MFSAAGKYSYYIKGRLSTQDFVDGIEKLFTCKNKIDVDDKIKAINSDVTFLIKCAKDSIDPLYSFISLSMESINNECNKYEDTIKKANQIVIGFNDILRSSLTINPNDKEMGLKLISTLRDRMKKK